MEQADQKFLFPLTFFQGHTQQPQLEFYFPHPWLSMLLKKYFDYTPDLYKHKLLVKPEKHKKEKVKAAPLCSPQIYHCFQVGGHFPTPFSMYRHKKYILLTLF